MMDCKKIKQMIEEQLLGATVIVESQDKVHFAATVISDLFKDENLLKRQRRVYACLGDHIHNGDIHALTLKTWTQQEWENKNHG